MQQLVGVVERGDGEGKKSFWTRIGTAFKNEDGSWNLLFDYTPAMAGTTIQMRPITKKDDEKSR